MAGGRPHGQRRQCNTPRCKAARQRLVEHAAPAHLGGLGLCRLGLLLRLQHGLLRLRLLRQRVRGRGLGRGVGGVANRHVAAADDDGRRRRRHACRRLLGRGGGRQIAASRLLGVRGRLRSLGRLGGLPGLARLCRRLLKERRYRLHLAGPGRRCAVSSGCVRERHSGCVQRGALKLGRPPAPFPGVDWAQQCTRITQERDGSLRCRPRVAPLERRRRAHRRWRRSTAAQRDDDSPCALHTRPPQLWLVPLDLGAYVLK